MLVTVLLADDAQVVREAIRRLLAESPDLIVLVGEAVDFAQTIQMANDLQPHVIVFDLNVARSNEPSEVRNRLSKSKTLAISFSNDDESKKLAERYGALALLDKTNLFAELVPAILKVAIPTDSTATTYPE